MDRRKLAWPRAILLAWLLLGAGTDRSKAGEITDTVTLRVVRPDRQLERLIALFRGSRATDPAAALAAWKRAAHDSKGLGKPLEAAIAALNPPMVRELRGLGEVRAGLGLDPGDGHIRWYIAVPDHDGSVAALATALVLTDGSPDLPRNGIPVDRLGPPGSPVAARVQGVLTLAGTREDLRPEPRPGRDGRHSRPGFESGVLAQLDASLLSPAGSVLRRRMVDAIRAADLRWAEAAVSLEGETLSFDLTGRLDLAPRGREDLAIDPSWLAGVPASGVIAAGAIAINPSPGAWDEAFSWADRVDRADPARAGIAPLRARLNLLAAAARVRPEVDLWPWLRGVSGCVFADPEGAVRGALAALQLSDAAAADRLVSEFLPRLAASRLRGGEGPAGPDGVRRLGVLSGRPLSATRRGTTVLIAWGESALPEWLAAEADPERSAGPTIRWAWGERPVRRTAAFWPGRLKAPLLAEAPPIVWWGWNEGAITRDLVAWTGLRSVVRRALERLPLDPPPDH